MPTTTAIKLTILISLLSVSTTCLAQDWAKSMESSTEPTDYQAILDLNLAAYNHSLNKTSDNTNLVTYEHLLSQSIQNMQASNLQLRQTAADPGIGDTTITAVTKTSCKGGCSSNGNPSSGGK